MKITLNLKLFFCVVLAVLTMGFSICSVVGDENLDGDRATVERINNLLKENKHRYEDFSLIKNWSFSDVVNLLKRAKAKKVIGTDRLTAINFKEVDKGLLTIGVEAGEGETATGNLLCFTWSDKKWRLFEVASYKNF